ncbi:unnamed protein product [Prorocentrum cordatum]|uniref:Beta-galactosidase n=1 Tax=Prorocentrum cordatum TaxID=2364126 RepID=A0ABN9XWV4_9DINO|nr:unnamed protein product [Polarella glacialis]
MNTCDGNIFNRADVIWVLSGSTWQQKGNYRHVRRRSVRGTSWAASWTANACIWHQATVITQTLFSEPEKLLGRQMRWRHLDASSALVASASLHIVKTLTGNGSLEASPAPDNGRLRVASASLHIKTLTGNGSLQASPVPDNGGLTVSSASLLVTTLI